VTIYFQDIESPLGCIRLTTNGKALTGCYFQGQKYFPVLTENWQPAVASGLFSLVTAALECYFRDGIVNFDFPLAPQGTAFQQQVWEALLHIPAGKTKSYRALALEMSRPKSTRAVAAAIGKNPISIIIPCHRVLGKNRSLTGYAGGLERKHALLTLEGVML